MLHFPSNQTARGYWEVFKLGDTLQVLGGWFISCQMQKDLDFINQKNSSPRHLFGCHFNARKVQIVPCACDASRTLKQRQVASAVIHSCTNIAKKKKKRSLLPTNLSAPAVYFAVTDLISADSCLAKDGFPACTRGCDKIELAVSRLLWRKLGFACRWWHLVNTNNTGEQSLVCFFSPCVP